LCDETDTFAKVKNTGWKQKKTNKMIILAKYMLYTAAWAKRFFLQPFANIPIFAAKMCA